MSNGGDVPNPETGVGIGASEGSTFEPEEDVEVVEPTAQPAAGGDEGGGAAQGDGAPDSH